MPLPNGPCDGKGPSREGAPTLDADRLDLNGIDLAGLSREDVLAALTDAAIEAYEDAAEFAWDESQHPRGQPANRGQFGPGGGGAGDPKAEQTAGSGAATLADGRTVHFIPHPGQSPFETMVVLDPKKLDAAWPAYDRIDEQGRGATAIPGRREAVRAFLDTGKPLWSVSALTNPDGSLRVHDGRHRLSTLRDLGADGIGVSVPRQDARDMVRRFGRQEDQARLEAEDRARREAEDAAVAARRESARPRGILEKLFGRKGKAAFSAAAAEAAEFYSPDQARDWRGRWTSGGGEGAAPVPTHAERGQLRQASLQAVRDYVRAGGQPTQVENEQLAAHLARLTVDQLHAVKAEHGLKASAKDKAALVGKLAERFRAHRQTQEPAGAKALKEAVAGKPGFHNVREVVGGHAVTHGPTGSQVRADHAGTRFDVLTSGSTLHSSHATAAAAVKAAEQSGRFGTGQSTAEQEHAARQEAMRKSQERAAQAKPTAPVAAPPSPAAREKVGGVPLYRRDEAKALPNADQLLRDAAAAQPQIAARARGVVKVADLYDALKAKHPSLSLEDFHRQVLQWQKEDRITVGAVNDPRLESADALAKAFRAPDSRGFARVQGYVTSIRNVPPAAAPPAPAGGGKQAVVKVYSDLAGNKTYKVGGKVISRAEAEERRRKGARFQAQFSVHGALSPEEAEERAALRRVESYVDRENARLRAVREGVGA